MSSSLNQDELEDGELDDDGECDDVAQDVAEPLQPNCVQDRITASLLSLAEASFSEADSRVDNGFESGEDIDGFQNVSPRQSSGRLHRQQRTNYDRKKPDRHRQNNDISRGSKKELKILEVVAAADTCDDVVYRAPPRRSRNDIWSKTQSGQLPYDSPHTSDDDGENPANHSDRLLPPQQLDDDEHLEGNSRVDRNRSRRRHRRHRTGSTSHQQSRSIDKDVDVSLVVKGFQNETSSSKVSPKSLLQSQSRKRKLVDTPMVERPVCKFFMDGKCVRGLMVDTHPQDSIQRLFTTRTQLSQIHLHTLMPNRRTPALISYPPSPQYLRCKGDECPFNHDCLPPKKPELCRFYMTGGCTKGTLCMFYHNDWPCRNFHRFGVCSYGDACKFSHDELSAETRKLLEMPCSFSEDKDTQPQQPQQSTPTSEKRKIPSLLDIPTYLPGTAPKSSPPGTISHVDLSRFGYFDEDEESDSESNITPGSNGRGAVRRTRKPPILGRPRAIYIEDDEDEDHYNEEEDLEEQEDYEDDGNQRFIENQRKEADNDNDARDRTKKHDNNEQNNKNQQNNKQPCIVSQHDQQDRYTDRHSEEQLSGENRYEENGIRTETKTSLNSGKPDTSIDSSRNEQRRLGDEEEHALLAGNDEDYDEFMRLPVAQRQLFMRIRNNQRQQSFTENKTDAPVVTGKADDGSDDKWYSSDEDDQGETTQSVSTVSSVGKDTATVTQALQLTSLPANTSQPPPLVFNVPPPLLMPPLMPPRPTNHVLNMPPYGLPVPNVPPPLIHPPQQGMRPPSLGIPMHGMPPPPHRLPPGLNMMGPPPMRPDLSPSLLGPGPRPMLPPGMMPPGHGMPPPSLLGAPAGSPSMLAQGPHQPHHGQGGLLGHGPHDALIRQGAVMGQSPQQQQPLGPMPGTNLLGQNINLPQFDIGQILSAIRNNMTTSTTSADSLTSASVRDPRASSASVASAADPRIRMAAGLPPIDMPDTKVSSTQPPESPSSPSSPPAVDNEVNVSGLRVAYFLRRLTINVQPLSIPSHVSLDELKQRSDPRLQRYQHRSSINTSGGVVRRQSNAGSPSNEPASETARHRSPSHYTLPDIILPPIPVRSSSDDSTGGTSSLRLPPSALPRVPEALLERNSTLLSEPAVLFQRQLSNASSDSNNDASEPKKVIDYRNDPRYKKKKTLTSSREENTTKRPSRTTAGQFDDSFQETFRSGFYGTANDDDDRGIDLGQYRSFGSSNEASSTDGGPSWEKEDRSISPPVTFNLGQPSSFMSLAGIGSSGLVEDQEHVSLKDMFKTIDPTNSPFC